MSMATKETKTKYSRFLWGRWLSSWALLTFWLGLMPLLVVAAYYGMKKPSDFDPALRLLPADNLLWSARVGSESCSSGVGIQSSSFGVNAENPAFQQARSEVWNGALSETHQATYLAWFRGSYWPAVFTVYRSVKPNGAISYGALRNGPKAIAKYLMYCGSLGAFAVMFFEIVGVLKRKGQTPSSEG
jgi:hypothetical protein